MRFTISKYSKIENIKFYASSFTSIITRLLNIVINIVTLPILYNSIGQTNYGILVSITAISIVSNFADLGLGFGLQSKISQLILISEDELNKAISYTYNFLITTSIFLFVSFCIIASNTNWEALFEVSNEKIRLEVVPSIYTFAFIICLAIPFSLAQKVQLGLQEGYRANIWILIGNVFSLLSTYLISLTNPSILSYIITIYGVNTLFVIVNYVDFFYIRKKSMLPKINVFRYKSHIYLLKDSFIFFLVQALGLVLYYSNIVLLLNYSGAKEVALFSVAYRFTVLFIMPIESIASNITPLINESVLRHGAKTTHKYIYKLIVLSLISAVLGSLIIYFGTNEILKIWVNGNIQLSKEIIVSMSMFLIMYASIGCALSYILLSNIYINKKAIIYSLGVIIAIVIKPHAIKLKSTSGAFWSTSLPMFLFYIIPSFFIIRNKIILK